LGEIVSVRPWGFSAHYPGGCRIFETLQHPMRRFTVWPLPQPRCTHHRRSGSHEAGDLHLGDAQHIFDFGRRRFL